LARAASSTVKPARAPRPQQPGPWRAGCTPGLKPPEPAGSTPLKLPLSLPVGDPRRAAELSRAKLHGTSIRLAPQPARRLSAPARRQPRLDLADPKRQSTSMCRTPTNQNHGPQQTTTADPNSNARLTSPRRGRSAAGNTHEMLRTLTAAGAQVLRSHVSELSAGRGPVREAGRQKPRRHSGWTMQQGEAAPRQRRRRSPPTAEGTAPAASPPFTELATRSNHLPRPGIYKRTRIQGSRTWSAIFS
jgi:hypothetical protein